MTRRLLSMSGLAILAVLCNHAGGWGFTAMFWWAHRYRPVTSPNYDQLGSLPFYGLIVVRQLAVFAVPVFLFFSGFFIAYAASGNRPVNWWKVIPTRLFYLLIPYLIWSSAIFISDAAQHIVYSPLEYLRRLMTGQAVDAYFFVPLLCQLYLISPFLISFAKKNWKLFLVIALLIQITFIVLRYLGIFTPGLLISGDFIAFFDIFFGCWLFFFALGIVFGLRLFSYKIFFMKVRWLLILFVIVFAIASIVESSTISISKKISWGGPLLFSASFYEIFFILCLIAYEEVQFPIRKAFDYIGKRSYGIYLIQSKAIELTARIIYHISPWILANQALFQPILIIFGIGIPLALIELVDRTLFHRYYRYLFG